MPDEVVLADDGSRDGSGALCDALREKSPDLIRVIHQENGGLSAATNSGIDVCCCEDEKLLGVVEDAKLRERMMDHCIELYYRVDMDADLYHHPDIRLSKEFIEKYAAFGKDRGI